MIYCQCAHFSLRRTVCRQDTLLRQRQRQHSSSSSSIRFHVEVVQLCQFPLHRLKCTAARAACVEHVSRSLSSLDTIHNRQRASRASWSLSLLASTELRNQNKCDEKPDCRHIVYAACPVLPADAANGPKSPSTALLPKRFTATPRCLAARRGTTRAHDALLLSNQSLFALPLSAHEASERNSHATAA